ncbi:hypothetical protein ANN_02410 [Periplaneta americana]|uniref:Uncharacterized protein n=1 Tax=Periplaneta americana TaxID=6978 RepID=A0ABQ8U0F9_PERAM|nr:hypothetical protein ANN_02410 [Periplaneta americana]
MVGLCEGGNEPPSSLKANYKEYVHLQIIPRPERFSGTYILHSDVGSEIYYKGLRQLEREPDLSLNLVSQVTAFSPDL